MSPLHTIADANRAGTVVRTGVSGGLSLSTMSMLVGFINTSACSAKASGYSGITTEMMLLLLSCTRSGTLMRSGNMIVDTNRTSAVI